MSVARDPWAVNWHAIEGTVRYLATAEGGRKTGVASGYRGQFFYDGDDCDGIQYFPDDQDGEFVPLGETVPVRVEFPRERWEQYHSKRIYVGMPIEIHEGRKTVGHGTVTSLEVSPEVRR